MKIRLLKTFMTCCLAMYFLHPNLYSQENKSCNDMNIETKKVDALKAEKVNIINGIKNNPGSRF